MFNNSYYRYDMYSEFRPKDKHTPVSTILIIVSILSVIGNILVVLISGFCMRLRSLTRIFILNLALSDLLFTAGPLFVIGDYIQGLTRQSACRVVGLVSSTGFYTNMVLLVLMNIQSYMVTIHSYSGWKKRCFVTLVFVCAWIVGITAALPEAVHIVLLPEPRFCMYSNGTTLVSAICRMNIFFVCASLIMCFCSVRILQTITKSPTNKKHRTYFTVLVLPLAATFFICWAPYNVMIFLSVLDKYWYKHDWYYVVNALYVYIPWAFSQGCINPVIYGLFGLKLRKEIFPRQAALNSAQIEIELNN